MTVLLSVLLLGAASVNTTTTPGVAAFVRDHHLTWYSVALVDLNGDDEPEALVYAVSTSSGGRPSDECGSGGCDLYVLSLTPTGYRQVSDISITHTPIPVLPTVTHASHDLGVLVVGGPSPASADVYLISIHLREVRDAGSQSRNVRVAVCLAELAHDSVESGGDALGAADLVFLARGIPIKFERPALGTVRQQASERQPDFNAVDARFRAARHADA